MKFRTPPVITKQNLRDTRKCDTTNEKDVQEALPDGRICVGDRLQIDPVAGPFIFPSGIGDGEPLRQIWRVILVSPRNQGIHRTIGTPWFPIFFIV